MGRKYSNLNAHNNKIELSRCMYNLGGGLNAYLEGFLNCAMAVRGTIMSKRWGQVMTLEFVELS